MTYILIGLLILVSLIFYGMESLNEAIKNTRNAISGKEKMKEKSIIAWMNLTTILIIAALIVWQKEIADWYYGHF